MRLEDRDGWGNLGNKGVDPDDRSCRNLAPAMARTWEGWEQTGARWAEKQGGEWSEIRSIFILLHFWGDILLDTEFLVDSFFFSTLSVLFHCPYFHPFRWEKSATLYCSLLLLMSCFPLVVFKIFSWWFQHNWGPTMWISLCLSYLLFTEILECVE